MTVNEVVEWLQAYFAHPGNSAEIPGDGLGTTFAHCGGVVLASLLSSTRSPEQLAELTGLPVTFIAVVIANMDYNQLWHAEAYHELRGAIHHHHDYDDVEDALRCFLEKFWTSSSLPGMAEILPAIRGVSLLFGQTQKWTDSAAFCD